MAESTRQSIWTSNSSTSYTSASASYPSFDYGPTTVNPAGRPRNCKSTGRPSTARPRTGVSTIGVPDQELICALTESRGISSTVGLVFINLDTGEAVVSQINDSQTYVRTLNKLRVYSPSLVLIPSTTVNTLSKLYTILEENQEDINYNLISIDRRYYAETTGLEAIHQLAFTEDIESIKVAVGGNYFAVCCFAAALKYIEFQLGKTFSSHSLRVKYEPPEGTMMIDAPTICALELIQNLQNPKSKQCLYGLLNETQTPMGSRLLRSNILQPSTNIDTINRRYDAVDELTTKEDMFFAVRQALKGMLDAEKLLTTLIVVEIKAPIFLAEESINKMIALKQFINSIRPIYEALAGARTDLLVGIRSNCASEQLDELLSLINKTINEDVQYSKSPLELRNQRTFAVKSSVHGLLDVARTAYKELTEDAYKMVEELSEAHNLPLELKFDPSRHFYIRLRADESDTRSLPPVFINIFKRKKMVECQVLDLVKLNQKIAVCHEEIVTMSDNAVQALIGEVRTRVSTLFKSCESIALLDMFAAYSHVATTNEYVRPQLTDTLAIQAGRHPVREVFQPQKYIPNDVYASQQTRFQIITGSNMSGKSTYIRSIALMTVLAQIGSFVPASYASFPIMYQLFARVNMDDSIEANVSTFAAEMRETAFILRNIDSKSIAIIDELGRGTSTRDGLAIALAIAEALINSRAFVWFVTHFRDLATIMSERAGVINLHLAVNMCTDDTVDNMNMLYRIAEGPVQEKHYGLKLARVVPLPPKVYEIAEQVVEKLEARGKRQKAASKAVVREKKRKLVLSLKEHLTQARNGALEGDALSEWLKELQREFVERMTAIDREAEKAAMGISNGDESGEVVS